MEKSLKNNSFLSTNKQESSSNIFEKVKSLNIFKYILSFISINNKLNLIIYNKKFQKKLKIDIDYYKKISGIEKIIEKNGKGKEYKLNTNIMIFQGEYLKGKRNGKGYEYYITGELKFEGDYLNGVKTNGFGYDYQGNIILYIL